YGIVLDAGSSHTAMFIYKWPADKQNDTGIVSQHSECHVKGGGISSYAGQKGGAALSLESCMEQAMKNIPKARHQVTPLYLGATAGMRLLNISQPKVSDEILKEVEEKLKSYPFRFKGASILTGQEEGAYGWVTVNYLLENFIKYGFVGHWLSPGKETVGALDFGGASTQITFETKEKVEDKNNLMTLQLYGKNYSIYTQSFLCYGRDQMLRQLLAHLIQSQGTNGLIVHPCFPEGYNVSKTLDTLFDSPCTASSKPSPFNEAKQLTIVGSGNYNHCLKNMSQIFSFNICSYSKCSFNGVFQPIVAGKFMAFSAFYYIYYFLQRATGITVTSPKLLEEAAINVCNLSFPEMLQKFPEQQSRLQDYCAATVFMQVLLLRGYGFDQTSFSRISFQKKAGDTSIGWALGYILNLSSLLPSESVSLRKAICPGAWSMLVFLFTFLFILATKMFAGLSELGISNGEDLKETLTNCTEPLKAIDQFQMENGILLPTLQSALPFLDLHGTPRLEFHQSVFDELRDKLMERVAFIAEGKDEDRYHKLEELLEKSFPLVRMPSIQPVVMQVMKHLPKVPEKKLKQVMADKELYKVCAVEVKRQIWQDNQALFGDEVSPLLKQYIVEKEAALFSNDLSILHNFFSPSPKTRRQGEVVQKLTQMIGKNVKLYDMVLQFLRTLFLRTRNVHYCTLRAELLMSLHDLDVSEICSVDPCHKFTWCLDACIREKFVDAKRARELQGFLDSMKKGQEQVLGDLSMILCDPFASNTLVLSTVRNLQELLSQDALPRDSPDLLLLLRMLCLGQGAWDMIDSQVFKEPRLELEVVTRFLPAMMSIVVDDYTFTVEQKLPSEEKSSLTYPNTLPDTFTRYLQENRVACEMGLYYVLHIAKQRNKNALQRLLPALGVATANHLSPPIPIFCILNPCTH
ncbi:hypothetical protein QTP86_020169, partial [Hemibagrus guttatus]